MAQLLNEIEWGQALLPRVGDPAWEAEVKRRAGRVNEVDRRVAANPWVREVCVSIASYRPAVVPQRLFNIGALVTAQENSCRYCYGANRAFMRMLGYSESFISRIERDSTLADLDEKERAFIAFCRNLARSRPRPMKAEVDALVALGFTPMAVAEMAMLIVGSCFYNRIGILIACPPELGFERVAHGFLGRILGPMMRLAMSMQRAVPVSAADVATLKAGPFGTVVAALVGVPGATSLRAGLDGAFASAVLPKSTKALMFAVVARTLDCRISEREARTLLADEGFDDAEIDSTLLALRSSRLSQRDIRLLSWVRETVHYQTAAIQAQTRTLAGEFGDAVILEAIGVAALSNAVVRLAMLLE